jgi:hypothetical protein
LVPTAFTAALTLNFLANFANCSAKTFNVVIAMDAFGCLAAGLLFLCSLVISYMACRGGLLLGPLSTPPSPHFVAQEGPISHKT